VNPAPGTEDREPPDFRVVTSATVCEAGFLTVARKLVVGPDGRAFDRHVVHHPGAVAVVPIDDAGDVLMVRQYRVATGGAILELPAGKRDVAGEPPAVTAARELQEELGRRPGALVALCEFYNSPGFTDEYTYVFLATELSEGARAATSAEEAAMTIEAVPFADVAARIAAREIVDGKSIIGLLVADRYLAGRAR
jgi:ADP-ribose pyrophosphatase